MLATKERRRQAGGVILEIVDRDSAGKALIKRHRARITCPLDDYFWRGCITPYEYQAGMKFRAAYMRAVLKLKIDDIGGGSQGDPEMSFLAMPISEQILGKAYAILSPAQKNMVITACGHDDYLRDKDRIQTLHRGLEKLAELWNFV
jgi:hypothetical protein